MKKFSTINGKSTNLTKPFTFGSVGFIVEKAGTMSATSIAAILHRPVTQVYSIARKIGVSLEFNG